MNSVQIPLFHLRTLFFSSHPQILNGFVPRVWHEWCHLIKIFSHFHKLNYSTNLTRRLETLLERVMEESKLPINERRRKGDSVGIGLKVETENFPLWTPRRITQSYTGTCRHKVIWESYLYGWWQRQNLPPNLFTKGFRFSKT